MLAVVYETFTSIEKEKMKKLYLHKQKGCELAFNLLLSKTNVKELRFKQFQGLMKYFAADKSKNEKSKLLTVIIFIFSPNIFLNGNLFLMRRRPGYGYHFQVFEHE